MRSSSHFQKIFQEKNYSVLERWNIRSFFPKITFLINNGGNQLLYRHFNLHDHSVLSMKVRILEKIFHPINKPIDSCTPFRRKREEHWIRQLGTAAPYGCNDHIDSIGNLTSPGCQSVNVLNLFNRTSRRHRSHGSRRYNTPEIHLSMSSSTVFCRSSIYN